MRRIRMCSALAAIVLIGTVAAAPVIPQGFFGAVFLNGNPAPAGTIIRSNNKWRDTGRDNDNSRGTNTVAPVILIQRLSVNSTEDEVNAGNATVTFIVGGVQAFQIVPFKSGGPGKLDLIANNRAFPTDTTASPAYSSSGSPSAGSSGHLSEGTPSSSSGSVTSPGNAVRGTTCYLRTYYRIPIFNLLQCRCSADFPGNYVL